MSNNDDRSYPARPYLGVGGLVFLGEQILLVERGHEPLKGWWSLPGGILETGEKLEAGVRREVLEETSLDVEVVELFEVFERIMPDAEGRAKYHYVLLDYICRPVAGELKPSSDASRAAWVSRCDLSRYRITEGTLAVVERAFDHVGSNETHQR